MIFDLDGTLVQTEKLKALSYARAAVELCPYSLEEEEVIEAFKEVVGRSRREVATFLVERFDLAERARDRFEEYGVNTAWQAYVQVRLGIYLDMLADPEVIRSNQWPHNVTLLQEARRAQCRIGLATMSYCPQATRILDILSLREAFDFVATRDDVERGKPDPEIYLLVASELSVDPADCLVIEDSVSGVEAALSAGMHVVAVATPFTGQSLHEFDLLPTEYIVDDYNRVSSVVAEIVASHRPDDRHRGDQVG
jgi:HAD superfamily hydrolase (TIGR01549 family)